MKGILLTTVLILLLTPNCFSQVPVISNVSTYNHYPKGTVVITGSGFSSDPKNLQVWFGQVEGKILSASDFSIEVEVPPSANLANIEVINKLSRRSVTSSQKFSPRFYGEPFDVSKLSFAKGFTQTNELRDIVSGDLNNDGKPELICTKFSAATEVFILHNISKKPGHVDFVKMNHTLNYPSDHIVVGDTDADGNQDLVITKGGSSNRNTVFVVRNLGRVNPTIVDPNDTTIRLNSIAFSLPLDVNHVALRSALRDLNGDGRPEIVVTNLTNNIIYIFKNDPAKALGTNPYNTTPQKITVGEMTSTYGLDVQDLDGDGKADILLSAVSTSDHYVLRNISSASSVEFSSAQRITLPGQLRNVTSADLNKDGKLDLITSSTGSNTVSILINQSTSGNFAFATAPIQLACDNAPWGISLADMEGDGDPDIVVANQLAPAVNIFLHDGNFDSPSFAKTTLTTARPARNVVAADLDRDGRPEISIASFVIGTYSADVYRNTICHKPTILNEEPLYVCNNPVELKAVPGINVTFDWKQGSTSIKNSLDPFASVTSGGTYSVYTSTVYPVGECVNIASQPINVTGSAGSVPENPVITLSSATVCSGATLTLNTDPVAGASYKWTGPNYSATTTTNTASIPNIASSNAGAYTVQVIIGNCKSNVSAPKVANVVAVDNFVISSNSPSNSACLPGQVTLSVNSVTGFTYAWKKDSEAYSTPSTVNTKVADQDGMYSVKISNTTLGCPDREVGPVKVTLLTIPAPDFTIGTPRCANAPISFTNNSVVDADSQADENIAPVWSWTFGNGKTSSEKNPEMTFTEAVTYKIRLTANYKNVFGCSAYKEIDLVVTPSVIPVINPSANAICAGESATLVVSGTYSTLDWEHGVTGATISVSEPGTYTVKATDQNGCIVPKSIEISSKEVPVITISPESPAVISGQSIQLIASGAHLFTWTPAESLNDSNVPDPVATPLTTTTYKVVGSYADGCSAEAQVTVLVDVSQINLNPPLAFSPNGDTDHEKWEIEGIEKYPDCTMNIFDSRGRRIYQKKGYDNQWDGTYDGKPVPDGTYYFVLGCPDAKPLTGSILVFR